MVLSSRTVLVTGAAGFIGGFFCARLLSECPELQIVGIDNLNGYYDTSLKKKRLELISVYENFVFVNMDISDKEKLQNLFEEYLPGIVVNLAAQAGVRYSIENPDVYIASNIIGFYNILECCKTSRYKKNGEVTHLIYASSSSVYGDNKKIPFAVEDKVDKPVSLYAATKKSNELMAYAYSKLYGFSVTGLRFFTVYGPLGRPDMAYYKFADKMVRGEAIELYNYGEMYRDFTYIDDIIDGILRVIEDESKKEQYGVPYRIYNIGNGKPESLKRFVEILEEELICNHIIEKKVEKILLPMQPGDVYQTYADVSELKNDFGFTPSITLEEGLKKFVHWYGEWIR